MIFSTSFKKTTTALTIALAFGTLLFSCQQQGSRTSGTPTAQSDTTKKDTKVSIAYVNLDTLEEKYTYFKESKEAFEKHQASIEAQLKSAANALQEEYIKFQNKAQAGQLSQTEGEAAQRKLQQMQQDLETKRQTLTQQLLEEQDKFTQKLQNQLDSFLADYNKDKHYDYVLSYAKGGSILVANPDYDITNDVLKEMNEAYQAEKKKEKKK